MPADSLIARSSELMRDDTLLMIIIKSVTVVMDKDFPWCIQGEVNGAFFHVWLFERHGSMANGNWGVSHSKHDVFSNFK